jgi:hypothetical protein
MLLARRSRVRFPMRYLDSFFFFSNLPNPYSCTIGLGSTQPLREMTARTFLGGKERPARKPGNLAAICEPLV